MSLLPMLFSEWWEDLDRPHRLWDQHFGTMIDPEDILNDMDSGSEVLLYRPHRRHRKRYHPFLTHLYRKQGRGTSTVQADKDKFQVSLDVSQFKPEEVNVKVSGQNVVVEAKHDEKEDEHGWVSRKFVRKYIVPSQCDIDKIESNLSSDNILSITVPRKQPSREETNERIVKIQYTGKPAVTDSNEMQKNVSESQKEQQAIAQRGQQQQHHDHHHMQQVQQQYQHQRSRKGTKI